jgi:GAF domain-containing protein
MYHNGILGFLGFGSAFDNRNWTEDDISLLKILGKIIANALMKKLKSQVN